MFWTRFDDGFQAVSDIAMDIYEALEKAEIEVPFPQRVITYADTKPKKNSKAEYFPAREVKRPKAMSSAVPENIANTKSDNNPKIVPDKTAPPTTGMKDDSDNNHKQS